jgi:hypothetical protein
VLYVNRKENDKYTDGHTLTNGRGAMDKRNDTRVIDTFLSPLANDESIYSLITRTLHQSVDIVAEDDGETYRISLPSITRRVNKKEADTLLCLIVRLIN